MLKSNFLLRLLKTDKYVEVLDSNIRFKRRRKRSKFTLVLTVANAKNRKESKKEELIQVVVNERRSKDNKELIV